jgi:hypothetical protein
VEYGPSGGTVDEAFAIPTPPTIPDTDEAVRLNLGLLWTPSSSGSWIGNRIYTSSVALVDIYALAFQGSSELERKQVLAPAVGASIDIMFDDPPPVVAATTYLAAYSVIRYAASGSGAVSWPYTTAHMSSGSGSPSRFASGPVGTVPSGVSGATYHVSPIVRFSV